MRGAFIALIATVGLGLVILATWPTGGCLAVPPSICPGSGSMTALLVDGAAFAGLALYIVVGTIARIIRRTH
jgi:hypothetical protein